jgi:hypothetical protein
MMQKEQNIQNVLSLVTIMTTVLLPLLYLFGYAYELGYLDGYGISNQLFPRSIPEYLTSCLLFFFITFSLTAKYLVISFYLIVVVFVIYAILHLAIDRNSDFIFKICKPLFFKLKQILLWFFSSINHLNLNVLARPAKFTAWILLTLYCLLSIMLVASILTIIPLQIGKKVAVEEIKKAQRCEKDQITNGCISLSEYGNIVASGKLVASSDKYIALYNDGKTIIYSSKDYDIISK